MKLDLNIILIIIYPHDNVVKICIYECFHVFMLILVHTLLL